MKALQGPCDCVASDDKHKVKKCGVNGDLVRLSGALLSVVQYVCDGHVTAIGQEGLTITPLTQVEAECAETT